MEYKKMKDNIYLRVDKGENVTETIKEVCKKEGIYGGYFGGIGACSAATFSTYIPEQNDFIDHEISGMIEMVSLMGNITMDYDKQPFLHSHAVFSYLNQAGEIVVTAGHLKEAKISYTGEIIITLAGDTIGRQFNADAGIEVWRLL